jgi:hypothetical protein
VKLLSVYPNYSYFDIDTVGYVLIARHSVIMTKTVMNTVQFMNPGAACIESSS